MDWMQFSVFIVSMGGLFLWNRAEARSDSRQIIDLISAINQEIKDFHGRLCAIEEKGKK